MFYFHEKFNDNNLCNSISILNLPETSMSIIISLVDNFDLSSIRMVLIGAAPLGKELEAALLCHVSQTVLDR